MPRYFFDVADGTSYPDREGTQLADVDAARVEAVRMFGAMIADDPEEFWNGDEWKMTCADADGMTLFEVMFHAVDAPASPRRRLESRKLRSVPTAA